MCFMHPRGCSCQPIRQVKAAVAVLFGYIFLTAFPAQATVLWTHPGTILVCDNGKGQDILHGAIPPQGSNSSSTLYFRFRVDPIADAASKSIADFQAGFVFVEKGKEHLGIGNAREAWAYSAWNVPKSVPKGFVNFNSANPVPPYHWEYVRSGVPMYIAFKVQYIPGQLAHVTVWLNPDLSVGATEINQPTNIVTHFDANATFDEIHLIFRGGNGTGWKFSQMVAGTRFEDLLLRHFWQRTWFLVACVCGLLVLVAGTVQLMERRRARDQLQRFEKEKAVAMERARIAQDIHDEVGTSLTKISKLSERMCLIGKNAAMDAAPMHAIATTARNTIQAMDEIVWAINPRNDTLTEMADYLVYFTKDFLSLTGIGCVLEVPLKLPDIPIASETRHNMFKAVKEALNNAVKHAAPRQIRLALELRNQRITVIVADDGTGFNLEEAAQMGNGLDNMRKRMSAIGGEIEYKTQAGCGTSVKFHIPLREKRITS